jgi:hypothetical protein
MSVADKDESEEAGAPLENSFLGPAETDEETDAAELVRVLPDDNGGGAVAAGDGGEGAGVDIVMLSKLRIGSMGGSSFK